MIKSWYKTKKNLKKIVLRRKKENEKMIINPFLLIIKAFTKTIDFIIICKILFTNYFNIF